MSESSKNKQVSNLCSGWGGESFHCPMDVEALFESRFGFDAANNSGYIRPHLSTMLLQVKLVDWLALRDEADFAANSKAVVNSFVTAKM